MSAGSSRRATSCATSSTGARPAGSAARSSPGRGPCASWTSRSSRARATPSTATPTRRRSSGCARAASSSGSRTSKQELGPGEAVYIEKDVVHGSYTLGDEPAKLTVILTPTAGEGGYEVIDVFEEEPWASLR